ncbi:MAG: hypothetical protein QY321_01475 [Patescibacteria group bacterium]|nr:MAG: hypothetical protein QY321_01475 [Patescibacteria group bacterium]
MIKKTLDFFLDCLFPKLCLGCGLEGYFFCSNCRRTFLMAIPGFSCLGCRKRAANLLCPDCTWLYSFDGAFIGLDYHEALVKEAVRLCKYGLVKELSQELAEALIRRLERFLKQEEIRKEEIKKEGIEEETEGKIRKETKGEEEVEEKTKEEEKEEEVILSGPAVIKELFSSVIVPIPLSSFRQRWRGFNQSEMIATRVGEYFGLEVKRDLLKRKHRKPQAKLKEEQRKNNIKGAFYTNYSKQEFPSKIILVDDVITTGATASEAAKILKQQGAEQVWLIAGAG